MFNSDEEAKQAQKLAIGRIWSMFNGVKFENRIEEFDKCKNIIMDAAEFLGEIPKEEPKQIAPVNGWNFG